MNVFYRAAVLSWFFLLQVVVYASPADSLRAVIPTLEGQEKSDAYRQLFRVLNAEEDAEATLRYLDEWIAYEHKQGHVDDEGKARWCRVVVMNNHTLDSMMLKEAPEHMKWFKEHGQWQRYYDTWDSKTNVYVYSGHLQTALREAKLILEDAQKRDNSFGRAIAYQLMGIIYETMGQYGEAVQVFRKCIDNIKENSEDSEALTTIYDYLCQTLEEKKDFEAELSVTHEWEEYVSNRIQSAKKQKEAYYDTYLVCLCNRAMAQTQLGRFDEARDNLKHVERILQKIKSPIAVYRVYYVHLRLALSMGNGELAQTYCDSLEALGIDAGGNVELMKGDAYMLQGRTKEAAEIFRNLFVGVDSTFTRDMRMQLDEMNTLYQVDELKMQTQLQRSRFLIGIAFLIVVVLLLFIFFRHRAALKLEREHLLLQESNEKLEQSYRELTVANAKAEESSKMKTNFIRQISHEIRTPLNILSGFTQVVTTPGMVLDDATKADINKRITENTDRITGLVNKMLELSDASSMTVIERTDDISAAQVAAQAVEESRVAQAKHIVFEQRVDKDAGNLMLHTNTLQAVRVLVLLLGNAQKFTKEGKIILQVTKVSPQQLAFIVEDTGIGIPASKAECVFEEFVQLDDYYEGTGIGLTVARSIAQRLDGNVTLDTTYVNGARFLFTLPLS